MPVPRGNPRARVQTPQGIGTVLQHIVHAAPYDHIGFFFCKIFYNLRLIAENIFIRNKFLTVRLNQLSPVK